MIELNINTKLNNVCHCVNVYTLDEIKKDSAILMGSAIYKIKQKNGNSPKRKILNIPLTFDIETTRYTINDEVFSFLYHWQFSINGVVVFGRTWGEFIDLLKFIVDFFKIDKNTNAIIYVHNLPYEFQFMYTYLPIKKVFARENNQPIYVELGEHLTGLTFKCSYALSGYSLLELSLKTKSCPFIKPKEDFDYSKIRTPSTPLTENEQIYCAIDVLILHYYILDRIENEPLHNIANIPLTKTSYVRRECRNLLNNDKEWSKLYKNTKLNADEFLMYFKAFRGGDTHANSIFCGHTLDNVMGFDLSSSYPYRLVAEKFPSSPPHIIVQPTDEEYRYILKNKMLHLIDITIYDVTLKDKFHFAFIPKSKCENLSSNSAFDNGRVVKAEFLKITVTSIDFEIIKHNYNFKIACINKILFHRQSDYLPEKFRNYVLKLFSNKTKLKGIEDEYTEYMKSKEYINSVYGMCVTNPLQQDVEFNDGEWTTNDIDYTNFDDINSKLNKLYSSKNHFLPYLIGVWTTAYARKDLHTGLNCCGNSAVYWDTDSVKFVYDNSEKFKKLNEEKIKHLLKLYTPDEVSPKDISGKHHIIGLWEPEYKSPIEFKTFGSKKYFYIENGESHLTVAGLNKNTAIPYLLTKLKKITDIELNTVIPAEYSGRTSAEYINEPFTLEINNEIIHENSYLNINPVTYTLNDTYEHKLYCLINQEGLY